MMASKASFCMSGCSLANISTRVPTTLPESISFSLVGVDRPYFTIEARKRVASAEMGLGVRLGVGLREG